MLCLYSFIAVEAMDFSLVLSRASFQSCGVVVEPPVEAEMSSGHWLGSQIKSRSWIGSMRNSGGVRVSPLIVEPPRDAVISKVDDSWRR